MTSSIVTEAILIVRNATLADVPEISALVEKVYDNTEMEAWPLAMLHSHIETFPEGQFVAVFANKIISYSASMRISGEIALKPHTWDGITGNGYATTHESDGDYLYGMETCVDPDYWNHHIGQRLYNIRKELCVNLALKGIVAGGRLPYLAQYIDQVKTPERYIEQVQLEKIKDKTLLFQLHNGFEVIGVLKDYLPGDDPSLGYASHLLWRNPEKIRD